MAGVRGGVTQGQESTAVLRRGKHQWPICLVTVVNGCVTLVRIRCHIAQCGSQWPLCLAAESEAVLPNGKCRWLFCLAAVVSGRRGRETQAFPARAPLDSNPGPKETIIQNLLSRGWAALLLLYGPLPTLGSVPLLVPLACLGVTL